MGRNRTGKKVGKVYGAEFEDKSWRWACVARCGRDPVMEDEMHVLVAEQKLLQLEREAAEKAAAEKAAEKAAAEEAAAAEAPDAAAPALGEAPDAAAPAPALGEAADGNAD